MKSRNSIKARNVAFVCKLAFEFPDLLRVLQEHLDDNFGEILPHLLMEDYSRQVEELVEETWIVDFLQTLEASRRVRIHRAPQQDAPADGAQQVRTLRFNR